MTGIGKPGRKPADQAGGGRQAIWQAIKRMPPTFGVADIAAITGMHRKTILDYLTGLTAGGFLGHEPAPPGKAGSWTLLRDVGHHAPRVRPDGSPVTQGDVNAQLWLSMIGLKDFDCRDLIHSSPIEIAEATVRDYVKHLLAAGYLKVLVKADPSRARIARYRLIRNSGPKPPQVQRVKRVFDPNTGAVWPAEARA